MASCSAATALALRGHLLSRLSGMLVEHVLHDGNEVCAQVLHAPQWREIPLRLGNVHVAALLAVQLLERGPRLRIV